MFTASLLLEFDFQCIFLQKLCRFYTKMSFQFAQHKHVIFHNEYV